MLPPTSVWTQPLPDDVPLDPSSSTYIASIAGGIKNLNFLYEKSAHRIFWANESTPRQKVWLDAKDSNFPKLRAALASVPIPAGLRPPTGTDKEVMICLRKADGSVEYFGFHGMQNSAVDGVRTAEEIPGCTTLAEPGWHCTSAEAVKDLNRSPGYVTEGDWPGGVDIGAKGNLIWGISASRTTSYPHSIKVPEALATIKSGRPRIDHALRLAIPRSLHRPEFRWPVLASDGESTNPAHPPTGCLLFFDQDEDFSGIGNTFIRLLCESRKRHPFILTDSSGKTGNGAALKCEAGDAWKLGPEPVFTELNEANPENETAPMGNQIPLNKLKVIHPEWLPSSIGEGVLL
jgi:hypothetical protein